MNLKKYVDSGLTWGEYVAHMQEVIENGDKENDKYQYYSLNLTRMERLAKKIKLTDEQQARLSKLGKDISLIMITEGWCGDASQILPVVHKLVEKSEKVDDVVNLRDSSDLIDKYLTNGGKSIPIIVGVDAHTHEELFKWGPRPAWGADYLKRYKSGEINHDEFVIELQKKYNKDKGQTILNEFLDLMQL